VEEASWRPSSSKVITSLLVPLAFLYPLLHPHKLNRPHQSPPSHSLHCWQVPASIVKMVHDGRAAHFLHDRHPVRESKVNYFRPPTRTARKPACMPCNRAALRPAMPSPLSALISLSCALDGIVGSVVIISGPRARRAISRRRERWGASSRGPRGPITAVAVQRAHDIHSPGTRPHKV
jgi:hypothetical protein